MSLVARVETNLPGKFVDIELYPDGLLLLRLVQVDAMGNVIPLETAELGIVEVLRTSARTPRAPKACEKCGAFCLCERPAK